MPRKDINQIAFDVLRQVTGEATPPAESVKAKSGRKGGLKGGAIRASKLTAQERSKIASNAAKKRWHKS